MVKKQTNNALYLVIFKFSASHSAKPYTVITLNALPTEISLNKVTVFSNFTILTKQGLTLTVFVVRTYVVQPSKLEAHNAWGKKLVALMKKQPQLFSGVKSMRVLSHKYGGKVGGFTAMWKFDSLADAEKWARGFVEVKAEAYLRSEFLELIVPGSYSECIWEPVRTINRKPKKRPRGPR